MTAGPYTLARYGKTRHWAVYAPDGALVAVVLYLRGARELVRLLNASAGQFRP